jgi:hypothetical protein
MAYKLNVFTGNLDIVNKTASASATIPELSADPVSPVVNSTWVLRKSFGTPIGLLLALTHGLPPSYFLSYRTAGGNTVRVLLS